VILRIILGIIINCTAVIAVQPFNTIKVSGNVTDLELREHLLYIATDFGTVEFYDVNQKAIISSLSLPQIKDFAGDDIPAKIYDIDYDEVHQSLFIISQGQSGFANLYEYTSDKNLKTHITSEDKLMIKRLECFRGNLILGLLSNELLSYNLQTKEWNYRTQISAYAFSDFCFSATGKRCLTTDESGQVHILNTTTGELLYTFGDRNVDNVYQIDYKGNVIATAGQDRHVGVYFVKPTQSYAINSDFLVYSVGLSPSGAKLAYYANEENDLRIIDVQTKAELANCKGHQAVINTILFINENELYTAADEPYVYYWKLD
jgi:WD40 repeat protein